MRRAGVAALAVALVTLAGCGSSGSDKGTTAPPATGGSATGAPSGSSGDNSATMTFSGAFSGSVKATLCTGAIASIEVTVQGDSTSYRGSISATSFGFVGPEAADYSLKEGDAKPTVSADGTTFTVDHATLIDLISKKSVVVDGSVTCP